MQIATVIFRLFQTKNANSLTSLLKVIDLNPKCISSNRVGINCPYEDFHKPAGFAAAAMSSNSLFWINFVMERVDCYATVMRWDDPIPIL